MMGEYYSFILGMIERSVISGEGTDGQLWLPSSSEVDRRTGREVTTALEIGVPQLEIFEMQDLRVAHERISSGKTSGKLVIKVPEQLPLSGGNGGISISNSRAGGSPRKASTSSYSANFSGSPVKGGAVGTDPMSTRSSTSSILGGLSPSKFLGR